LQRAIEYEIDRQITTIDSGQRVIQETRLWNERDSKTYSMRSKEEAHDYRYFPEPDLPPLIIDQALLESVRASLPELPEPRRRRFIQDYKLSLDDAAQLTETRVMADYYEVAAGESRNPRSAANWILNELVRELRNAGSDIGSSPVPPESLSEMIRMIDDNTISGKMAKDVLVEMFKSHRPPRDVVATMGGGQLSDAGEILALVEKVVSESPRQTEQYLGGKTALLGYFVGQVIKLSGGRANPPLVNKLVKQVLDSKNPRQEPM
jgi:aspartyl-tRNA(Asn)/glutamyl-tRNA(Gln) amidotransferase subunit B